MMGRLRYLLHRDHFLISISAFLQLWLLRFVVVNLDFLNPVAQALDNFSITDFFFEVQHSGKDPDTNDLITLVDMTDLHARGDIGCLIEEVSLFNPLFVGVDLIFEGEKDDYSGNALLERAVSSISGKSVFSMKLTDFNSTEDTFTNSVRSYFSDIVGTFDAYTNLNDDLAGSCIRDFSIKQSYREKQILSFPAAIASVFDPSVKNLSVNDQLINFKNVVFPVISYDEIYDKKDLIDGHIVLIGTINEEQDMHNSPLGKMSGMELQAYSLLTLLEHKSIKVVPAWMTWLLAFLVCFFLELSIDIISRWVSRHDKSIVFVFLKESNVSQIIVLFIWVVFICWLMFILFVKYGICLSGGFILGLMALVCEGRELLKAVFKAIGSKYQDNYLNKTSILLYDD